MITLDLSKETIQYFNRKIYENQKEFFLESISRTFNRFYIGENIFKKVPLDLIQNMMNKPFDDSPSKKLRRESTAKKL
jgi:hypothetical protein